jgi:hypothetical protein
LPLATCRRIVELAPEPERPTPRLARRSSSQSEARWTPLTCQARSRLSGRDTSPTVRRGSCEGSRAHGASRCVGLLAFLTAIMLEWIQDLGSSPGTRVYPASGQKALAYADHKFGPNSFALRRQISPNGGSRTQGKLVPVQAVTKNPAII